MSVWAFAGVSVRSHGRVAAAGGVSGVIGLIDVTFGAVFGSPSGAGEEVVLVTYSACAELSVRLRRWRVLVPCRTLTLVLSIWSHVVLTFATVLCLIHVHVHCTLRTILYIV